MKKSLVAFFTSSFPYPAGEQFIETEIGYWSGLPWAKVVVCPYMAAGPARPVPDDIEIFPGCRARPVQRLRFAMRAIRSPLFWHEVKYLWALRRLSIATCRIALRSVTITLLAKAKALKFINRYGPIDLAYCYWNKEQAYAACLLKREGRVSAVVSRAHEGDLYEDRRSCSYIPLKRQFTRDFDAVYSISEEGKRYLANTYQFPSSSLQFSRLGVTIPECVANSSADGVIRIVSVSFCVQRKRIDKIVDAIRLACQSGPGVNFVWTHIGDGPLRAQLERLAVEQLGSLPNVTFKFAGAMPNQSVLAFYSSEPVDIFINCSESEGVPVSIMEAMSCGIPAIAPAVGGIPELVDNKCGMLVPEGAPSEETVAGMCRLAGGNRERYRIAARQRIVHAYCANTNFNKFIASIKAIAVVPGGSSSISAVNTMSGMQG